MEPTDNFEDTEIVLTHGDYRLTVSPYGASLRGLEGRPPGGEWQPLVTVYHGASNKAGGQGDVLIPFPGRIGGGKYTFNGDEHQLELNDKDGPNAIHGFVRKKMWMYAKEDDCYTYDGEITFQTHIDKGECTGYPFSLDIAVTYSIRGNGLEVEFVVDNRGEVPAPVAAGFHPYFTVGSDLIDYDWLHVPMSSVLEYDQHLIPTGRIIPVEGTQFDYRTRHPIGDTKFNTCYLDPIRDADGKLRVSLTEASNRHGVTVWMDGAFDYIVIYSGDPLPESQRRRSLAIEPMTCASDGFNHPEWGLVALPPGETFAARWGIETRWE